MDRRYLPWNHTASLGIGKMKERIQKILSARGLVSRRTAEDWIRAGRVCVNGLVCNLGATADPDTDCIEIDGRPLPPLPEKKYLMLNKPRGYVTTLKDEKNRKTAASLVDCGCRVYPVGRLDCDSEGLLLFTNDGALADRLMHPRSNIGKTYEVTVEGDWQSGEHLLARPIVLDGYRIRPPAVRLLHGEGSHAAFEITIHEGRNRQIRRMCQAAGLRVLRLCRIREGVLCLGALPTGKWRELTKEEIKSLNEE